MLQILFAFLAGLLTIAAPCILPLLPVILGVSLGHTSKTRPLYIVAGFVLVFAGAAVLLSVLARTVGLDPRIARTIGVIFLGAFGVLLLWPRPFDYLMSRFTAVFARASGLANPSRRGNWSGFILGMTLGIVWTPCAGPVLGSILTLVALQKEISVAAILLLAYAAGAGVPMLLIAYASQYLGNAVVSISRYSRLLQQIFGVIIIALAVAIYFNYDVALYAIFLKYCPTFNLKL